MLTKWLTRITMYRLMFYYLLVVIVLAVASSAVGLLPYNPIAIVVQTLVVAAVAIAANTLAARLLKINPNVESVYITAFIISLIVGPVADIAHLGVVAAITAAAIISKYLIVYRRKHVFNPAAFGVVLGALVLGTGASWWVGNSILLIPVLIGGLLVAQKIRRFDLVAAFLVTYAIGFVLFGGGPAQLLTLFINSPLVFFILVMLVEPQTSPGQSKHRIAFGAFVALVLTALQHFVPSVAFNLELSLLFGNLYAYFFGQNRGALLTLTKKQTIAPGIMSFWFKPERPLDFSAGQYLEISIPHPQPDSRGVRRYFTVASSPKEKGLLITSRFSPNGSSFKRALQALTNGAQVAMHSIAGDFVLPGRPARGYVFIAGGIGITPFRSIVKHMIETNDRTPATLFYSNRSKNDIVFDDVFTTAEKTGGLTRVYTLTDEKPKDWNREHGPIDAIMIKKYVPHYTDNHMFFVSGPEPMVEAFRLMLRGMGIARTMIRADFFPGYPPSAFSANAKNRPK
ncbi:oxidoreductase [Candidatus Berkelbacteria bacterium]|nr:oxidoreductase [Candidatus Berkelbacteria bacterium]